MSRSIMQELPVRLTPDEKARKSEQLVKALEDKDGLEHAKKAAVDDFKQRLTAKDYEVKRLTREVSTGIEYREVACEEVMAFGRSQVDLIRSDTGEVVSSRAMRPEERQEAMDFAGPGDDEDEDGEDVRAH